MSESFSDFFATVGADIEAEAAKVWGEIKSDAVVIAETGYADIKAVFTAGIPIAMAAIAQQVPSLVSGKEKFSNAVTSTAQQLEVALGPVAIGDVQSLVQMAYNGLVSIVGGTPGPAKP